MTYVLIWWIETIPGGVATGSQEFSDENSAVCAGKTLRAGNNEIQYICVPK